MKIYVAGKTQAIYHVRQVQEMARATGHTITHDWTKVVEANGGGADEVKVNKDTQRKAAEDDMLGVYQADLVIAVGHPHLTGTLWECGMAIGFRKPLWLVDWEASRHSVFVYLPGVHHVAFVDLLDKLWQVSEKRLSMEALKTRVVINKDGTMTFKVPSQNG